ncbi:putative phosphoesterase [Planctomycetales bacterium 10988]|nr:putative phosphoesterase [Planctomycetales bacterium 10988]
MKLLLCSDLHADLAAAQGMVELSQEADVVLIAGDLGNVRNMAQLEKTIGVLKEISIPTVLVPGNAESDEELKSVCQGWEPAYVLHGESVEISGVPFFGLGGGIPVTPFGSWSFDLTEDQAREAFKSLPKRAILVTHSPPLGVVDHNHEGRSLGSQAIREAILEQVPLFAVCGHIHASAGQEETLGKTPVYNAGPAARLRELPLPGE